MNADLKMIQEKCTKNIKQLKYEFTVLTERVDYYSIVVVGLRKRAVK